MSNTGIKWWGYVHENGSVQAKRYFDAQDIAEAHQSPFCKQVVGPFEANDREDALNKVKELCLNTTSTS